MVRIPFLCICQQFVTYTLPAPLFPITQEGNTSKGCKRLQRLLHGQDSFLVYLSTVDDVHPPRSPVSYNTRKGIRQKVAILQPLQPICNPFATFQKTPQQAVNPYTMRVYSVQIYTCNLCNLFSRVLVYRENFFYFFIFQHNP